MYDAITANEGYTYCSYLLKTDEVASDVLKEKLCFGTAKQKDIDRVTRKHGPDATNVYGRNPSEKTRVKRGFSFIEENNNILGYLRVHENETNTISCMI